VTEPRGLGPAAARNAGAGANGSDPDELLVFVDADVLVHPDAFGRIRDAFESQPELDAVFGAYDEIPEASDPVSGFRNLLHHHVHLEAAGDATSFWAGLGAVRRRAFERVGGFRADRFPEPSVEDIDLGMRMRAAGATIRLDPAIQGTHLKRWGLGEMVRIDFARRGVPWARLLLDSGGASPGLNLAPRHLAGSAASLAIAAGLLLRRPRLLALGLGALLAAQAPFYRLVWRRRGPGQAAASVPLHVLHNLTGAAAGVVAVGAHLAERAGPKR
jgi:cellulose synthase/poly-beta-1,6-N-acetylglucosamine synthase-like glycosyltransferase